VTLEAPAAPAGKFPESWMQATISGATVQFIESAFDQERTNMSIRRLFGEPRNVTFTPMSLRDIFLAMARNGREA
jgi:hypothetical protein